MLSISHVTTGAYIAAKVSNPIIAFPLILASHYLEDWIPHWDVGTGLSKGTRKRKDAFVWGVADLLIAFAIVFLFWQILSNKLEWWVFLGGIIGIVPDLLEAPRNFLGYEPSWLKPFNNFHHNFHHSIPDRFAGLLPQVILLLVIFLLK